jgi:hypothetical protein
MPNLLTVLNKLAAFPDQARTLGGKLCSPSAWDTSSIPCRRLHAVLRHHVLQQERGVNYKICRGTVPKIVLF